MLWVFFQSRGTLEGSQCLLPLFRKINVRAEEGDVSLTWFPPLLSNGEETPLVGRHSAAATRKLVAPFKRNE